MIHETSVTVAADHPAFAGHFPGRPILPGVVLLGWAAKALGDVLGRTVPPCDIASAKFLRPVAPGTRLVIRLTQQPSGAWRFDIVDGSDAVATGSLKVPAA
ncbi:3-hydroxyacyl-ACP dehydratase FabZ family protein [Azoarcus sp. KH32C]|uniref:3-hydroxyacyl-ACP dehydratase FabZ family protein n=1 Tax=Azoarcus sp. KH32C TaxID=748247 RepID=UPI0002386284|nr:beta-hydroxyacyl-ACP dehydratase [Azoarcus sp. KH32C]BAL24094.1 3-hydroxyacyl-(acyl-carrier-protein) dehydratase [Azoarcus sp. KH32C]